MPDADAIAPALAGTRLANLDVGAAIGAGSRCTVHAARWRGVDRALKVYKPSAVAKHTRHNPLPLAEYEFSSNGEYRAAPALAPYVAEPIDFLVTPTLQLFVQERLRGPLYYFWYQRASAAERERMHGHIDRMVAEAHRARIYGINLQALNVIVVSDARGEPLPKLFDFNRLPRHVHHSNRFLGLAVKLGLLTPERLDYMTLARFHDFRALERKIRQYGIDEAAG
ncbi:MAG TPA: hypothetical protein VE046_06765 [Steroidobacteraceae bacterium]|nr:hypothetical protein [Steroidobacteraceae bacterium]